MLAECPLFSSESRNSPRTYEPAVPETSLACGRLHRSLEIEGVRNLQIHAYRSHVLRWIWRSTAVSSFYDVSSTLGSHALSCLSNSILFVGGSDTDYPSCEFQKEKGKKKRMLYTIKIGK